MRLVLGMEISILYRLRYANKSNCVSMNISASIEEEISQLSDLEEIKMFLGDMGLSESGLERLVKRGYKFTRSANLFHSWTKETKA